MGDIQKIENSLNLSFEATEEEKNKSEELNTGYDEEKNEWEVIVKCTESNFKLLDEGYKVVNLYNNYAIVKASKEKVNYLATLPWIEYIEKPKNLFFQREIGSLASCIKPVQRDPLKLRGKGVIIGILDSGIDYRNMEFRNEEGNTRILNLWDQTLDGKPPEGYLIGSEFLEEEINTALANNIVLKSVDVSGHGTEVASVAAGKYGVAPEAELIVVKLGVPKADGFPRTTELMQGLDYLIRRAKDYKKPLAVNVSFGNTYGSHDGSSLVEQFVDEMANIWKTTICVGTGNEGNAAGHVRRKLLDRDIINVELVVDRRQISFDLQIWKYYEDEVEISLISPSGEVIGPLMEVLGGQRFRVNETEVLLYYGGPSPFSVLQEIYIIFIPLNTYVNTGIWQIELKAVNVITGEVSMWLPSASVLNIGTQFNNSNKEGTFTIPSTSMRAIAVGAYNASTQSFADFSGRGYEDNPRLVKPDVVAPGVNVRVTTVGGIQKEVSGTSFSTPFVTGGAALLMEWGVVKGNDPFLYGQKVKAYLRKGAQTVLGIDEYPNEVVGYGKICIKESIPS